MASTIAVDSKAHRFFCLDKIAIVKVEPGSEVSEPLQCSKYSVQYLFRLLKLDMEELNGTPHIISHLLASVQKSRLTVELCEECTSLNGRLSELCRQLEKLEMEVGSCLGLIHGKFTNVGIDKTDQLKQLMVGDNDVDVESLELLEKIRAAAFEKCSLKLQAVKPRVKIQKLTTITIVEGTVVNELERYQPDAVVEEGSPDAEEIETNVVAAAITENGIIHSASVSVEDVDEEIFTGDVDANYSASKMDLPVPVEEMSDHDGNAKPEKKIRTRSQNRGLETRGDKISTTKIPDTSMRKSMNKPKFRISRTKSNYDSICHAVKDTKLKVDLDRRRSGKRKNEPNGAGSHKLRADKRRGRIQKITTNNRTADNLRSEGNVKGAGAFINDEGTNRSTTVTEEGSLDAEILPGNVDHIDKIELHVEGMIDDVQILQMPMKRMHTRSQNKKLETRSDKKLLKKTSYYNVNSNKKTKKTTFPSLVRKIQPKSD